MAHPIDAPSRRRLTWVWVAFAAEACALAWNAVIDDSQAGDPAVSLGHAVAAIGPVLLASALLTAVGIRGLRRIDGRRRARTSFRLLTYGAALQTAALAWGFVQGVLGPQRSTYALALIIGFVALVIGLVHMTVLAWRRPAVTSARARATTLQPERPGDPTIRRTLVPAGERRIARSWRLTRTAWDVVRRDSTMIGIAAVSVVLGVAATGMLFWLAGWFDDDGSHVDSGRLLWISALAAWPMTFGGTFLNVALAAAADAALDGRRLTAGQALAAARGRLRQIVVWSLLAAGVGVLLQAIAERIPWGGRFAGWILGAAWGLVTFFAVPIIALEGGTATGCVKRSGHLIKSRWGEGIAGSVAIGAWAVVVGLPAGVALAVAVNLDGLARAGLLVGAVAALAAIGAVSGAVRQVFAVALYRYATDGHARGGFGTDDLEHPFNAKRRWLRLNRQSGPSRL